MYHAVSGRPAWGSAVPCRRRFLPHASTRRRKRPPTCPKGTVALVVPRQQLRGLCPAQRARLRASEHSDALKVYAKFLDEEGVKEVVKEVGLAPLKAGEATPT